jgi:hypothetical protein
MSDDAEAYVRGRATYRKPPAFEFKAADCSSSGGRGGGYARVRSWETREGRKRVVPVAIHRLAAVAWHLPDGTLGEDVHLSELDGIDVHHVQPEGGRGMPAANGEDWTEMIDHGHHSSITQAEKRAYAEDTKRTLSSSDEVGLRCGRCGDELEAGEGWTAEDLDGPHCMACVMDLGPDGTVTPV